ncbi:TetR family transcriptional regulator [Streptomyces sp. 8N616]|uniref:TetR family transcriptional regulator n=1 Tax=Streptomyces sp. 8N616 TaxID=3457414 RepID=UPI003FCFC06E
MQLRAEHTRQALIDAAAQLFDSKGLRATGLLDISRSAGVSKGALYFHFGSKDELATAVWREARSRAHSLARRHFPATAAPAVASVARFVVALTSEMRRDPVLRAGIRLEAEGELDQLTGPTLRQEWLTFLDCHRPEGQDGRFVAQLLAAVTAGLEVLGREDDTWWAGETVAGIWKLLLRLVPSEATLSAPESQASS